MKSFMSICLDKNSKEPIYRQLGDALLSLISDEILEPDCKLPPVRKMAECLKINSTTVVKAYKYLEAKHAVYSLAGSGTYVAPVKKVAKASYFGEPTNNLIQETDIKVDFTTELLTHSLFPAYDIKNSFNEIIDEERGNVFTSLRNSDCLPLINTVSALLLESNISTDKCDVFISDGINRIFGALGETILNRGDYILLEKPVVYSTAGTYTSKGLRVIQVPVSINGIDLDAFETLLKMYRPKAAQFTTYFQKPTNTCYSLENKKSILELCYKYGVIIIEEDILSDIISSENKVFLKALDYRRMVIYVKSITKAYMPWMNINICVIPRKLSQSHEKLQSFLFCGENQMQIKLLNNFINSIGFSMYKKKIGEYNQSQYRKTAELINDNLGKYIEFDKMPVGTSFWLKIKKGSAALLAGRCAKKGVLITPGSVYLGGTDSFFRLSCTYLDDAALSYGIHVLKEELTKLLL